MRFCFEPATDGFPGQHTRPPPVADAGRVCWRSGRKLQALQADRNFWAPQEGKQTQSVCANRLGVSAAASVGASVLCTEVSTGHPHPVPATKKKHFPKGSVSFCVCVRRTQHRFATQLQTSFDRRSTSFRLRTQNEVALCANSVVLRTNIMLRIDLYSLLCYNTSKAVIFLELLFDILVEAIFESFAEGFIAFYSAFVPQKVVSEKGKKIIGYVCLAISLVLFVGLFAGIVILVETKGQSFWGWLLISLNIIYLLTGITLKIISHIKK